MASSELKKTLNRTEHRPYPLPKGAWVLRMRWLDLLFMHWPVPETSLRSLVPPALKLDTFDGSAWLGITPFRMERTHPRFLPAAPLLRRGDVLSGLRGGGPLQERTHPQGPAPRQVCGLLPLHGRTLQITPRNAGVLPHRALLPVQRRRPGPPRLARSHPSSALASTGGRKRTRGAPD